MLKKKNGGGGADRNSIHVFRTIYGLADTHSIAWKLTVEKEPEKPPYQNQETSVTWQKKTVFVFTNGNQMNN